MTTDLPPRARNLAMRLLQLLATRAAVTVTIFQIDGRWYMTVDGERVEKLG